MGKALGSRMPEPADLPYGLRRTPDQLAVAPTDKRHLDPWRVVEQMMADGSE